jgi:hypothetical protein
MNEFGDGMPIRKAAISRVRINDTLTLLFDDDEEFESHHYAFHVSDAEFDVIFGRYNRFADVTISPLTAIRDFFHD